jgi:hypothetical protein
MTVIQLLFVLADFSSVVQLVRCGGISKISP